MPVSLRNDTNAKTTPKRNREKSVDVKNKTPSSDNVDDKENGSPKSGESLAPKTPSRKPRRSTRNSPHTPQPTITDMFAKKRIRSPKECEESETLQKKIKVENEQTQQFENNSNDPARPESSDKDKKMEEEDINEQNNEELNNSNNKNKEDDSEDSESKDDIKKIDNETSNIETDVKSIKEDFKKDESGNSVEDLNSPKSKVSRDDLKNEDTEVEKCKTCFQILNNSNLLFYQGHPQDAIEEFIALTNEKLVLAAGDEGDIMERPQTNATFYSVYDKDGHLCPIDAGLIESDVRLYLSGYLKSICSESPDIDEEAVPVKDVGPIIEWYIHGFDGGKKNCITLSTEFGEYNLMLPSAEYTPLMNNLYEKIWISKVTVEYLEEYHYLQPSYEDLLEVIREAIIPELNDMKMSEDILHKHAQFVCDQVVSLEADDDEDPPLITLPCMRELIKLMGIRFGKQKTRTKIEYKKKSVKPVWTKATTTPLVRKTFETFFSNQLDKADKELVLRRKRCGICESCQQPDCGECSACRAMAKFGGAGKTKKACVRRICPNMAVQAAEDSDPEDEEEYRELAEKVSQDKIEDSVPVKLTAGLKNITWIDEPIKTDASKIYYEKVTIDNIKLKIGDFVMVETSSPNIPALVTRIVYIWKEPMTPKAGYFHGEVFFRASDTVLGEVSDPQEVFLADRCCHGAPLSSILRLANVKKMEQPSNWFQLGGKEVEKPETNDDGKTYFYQKFYERFTARFEDIPDDPQCPNELRKHRFCPSCERKTKRDTQNIPKVFSKLDVKSELITESNRTEWTMVKWREFEYKKGCGVFLKPGTFKFKNMISGIPTIKAKSEKVDESIYTEYYRKSDNLKTGSNFDTMEPFCVGHIAAVSARGDGPLIVPQDIYLKVNIMYRPENTTNRFPQHEDLNLVYWSEELKEVPFSAVMGPCHLIYEKNIPSNMTTSEWLEVEPNRFYFRDSFEKSTGKILTVQSGTNVGRMDKVKDKGKGKGKGKSEQAQNKGMEDLKIRPLRTLDVFAGCGGLSEGLHQAGVADCRWAIENTEAAAHAYSLNNKNCTVFNEDCNGLLNDAMSGALHSATGLRLPIQGDVELLCGGPPCQGFSGMNRFNSREYSNFKNSLVASYLSYCDFYRPKYFILENVRNFVAYKKGMVLKLTLRCLLDMGYQCTFGILQAGNYGVPQTRRRLIILASAPGYKLPLYPEPTHVFSRRACTLTAAIDGKRFSSNIQWDESAPRRTCTIRDAMSDLPEIKNGANKLEMDYGSMPESHFQRSFRSKDESARLRDHICKNMAPLIQARMSRIPTTPGSDWRDLPNTSVVLSDGNKSKILQYRHHDKKNGRSPSGALRGVCACAAGKPCDPADKQEYTLIPWCLPHTGNRHNNWAGLYGRIAWEGYFSTTVTDPEPMGKQGRILHPEQNRVVSVRECARSQGFPDTYMFAGSIQDKHRQVGNAVPPPLGAALGREIKKAFALRMR